MVFKIDYKVSSDHRNHPLEIREKIIKAQKEQIYMEMVMYLMEHSDFITDEDLKPGNHIQKAAVFFPDANRFRDVLYSTNRGILWDDEKFK